MASFTESEFSRMDLDQLETPKRASITNVKHLSSYNWIEAPAATPTIAVPGSPPLWSAPQISRRLKPDSGLAYIAQNAARHPESPLEPLFRALYTTDPSFDIRSTDVVTDRNNIRKLLYFIDPSHARNTLEALTINIEVVKNTAIFCRDEVRTVEHIAPGTFKGYGREFEKAYTVAQISGSTGHHRIISYRFAGMNFIVRHETDGYVDNDAGTSSPKASKHTEDGLSSMLGALSLSSATVSPAITPRVSKLVVKKEGRVVPREATLEIKTRAASKSLDMLEVAPQLWASQTAKFVRAFHHNGTFQRPGVEDVTAFIKQWEDRRQISLRKLAALIRKIIDLVKGCGGNAVVKYDVERDKLVVCKVERKEMLPKDLYSKWDDVRNLGTTRDTHSDATQKPNTSQTEHDNMSAVSTLDNNRSHDADMDIPADEN